MDQVIPTLLTYAASNTMCIPVERKTVSSTEVISYATTSAPLKEHEACGVQHHFGSIEELERASRSPNFREKLSQLLPPTAVQSMIDFWQDEWII